MQKPVGYLFLFKSLLGETGSLQLNDRTGTKKQKPWHRCVLNFIINEKKKKFQEI